MDHVLRIGEGWGYNTSKRSGGKDGCFPLTPTLSLGEREDVRLVAGMEGALQTFAGAEGEQPSGGECCRSELMVQRIRWLFPLPEGEG